MVVSTYKKNQLGQVWWLMPAIPGTRNIEMSGSQFKALRSFLKNKQKTQGLMIA
jgi:hypothetical protein